MSILRYVYSICDLFAIGAGTILLFGLLTGELLDKWAALFLKYTLVASLTGFFLPLHYFTLVKICSTLSILISGMAILALRMFQLSGIWRSIFSLTTTIALYLNVVVAIDQFFMRMSWFTGLVPAQAERAFRTTQFFVMLLFAVIGTLVVKRVHIRGFHSLRFNTKGVVDKHVL